MTGRDGRSVGEILLEADHSARELLMDAPDLDAAVVLRTWGEVVQTAAELWAVLPGPPAPAGGPPLPVRPDVMAQLASMTDALNRGVRRGTWPGPGPTQPQLAHIADSFARAAAMVARHGPPTANRPRVRADADAARTRIVHTLYVAGHGVSLAVAAHVRRHDRQQARSPATVSVGALTVARPALHRLQAFELLAGAYVARTFPAALAGQHREDVSAAGLGEALAGWDVHAHRALAANPTAGHLRLVAMTQEMLTRHGAHVLRAAAARDVIDPAQHAARLEQPLEASRIAWAAAATRWSTMAAHSPRPDSPAPTPAAAQVRATVRALTVDGPGPAAADVMAARCDLAEAVQHLAVAMAASSDLANLVRDVITDPRVPFPARAVNAMAVVASTARTGDAAPGTPQGALVPVHDVTANRGVALTPPLRTVFTRDADTLVDATAGAAAAGTWLHAPALAAPTAVEQAPGHRRRPELAPSAAVGVPAAVGPRHGR